MQGITKYLVLFALSLCYEHCSHSLVNVSVDDMVL